MSITKRSVTVKKVPREISSVAKAELLDSLETSFENGHPRFVLDCSQLETMGTEEIHFLLCCLEEAMKHKGDVRLAKLRPEADAVLRSVGASRLFEIFDTAENAVSSYEAGSQGNSALSIESVDVGTEYAA